MYLEPANVQSDSQCNARLLTRYSGAEALLSAGWVQSRLKVLHSTRGTLRIWTKPYHSPDMLSCRALTMSDFFGKTTVRTFRDWCLGDPHATLPRGGGGASGAVLRPCQGLRQTPRAIWLRLPCRHRPPAGPGLAPAQSSSPGPGRVSCASHHGPPACACLSAAHPSLTHERRAAHLPDHGVRRL